MECIFNFFYADKLLPHGISSSYSPLVLDLLFLQVTGMYLRNVLRKDVYLMQKARQHTRTLHLRSPQGTLPIGGTAPIVVQSMLNTDTRNFEKSLEQIQALEVVGCEVVRLAVLDMEAVRILKQLCMHARVPLIADIHFDHKLAIASLEAGVTALRINPGNIGAAKNVDAVVDCAKAHRAIIRIGVNGGSLEKKFRTQHLRKESAMNVPQADASAPSLAEALVESALSHVQLLEKRGFYETKISLKCSSVLDTIAAYRLLAQSCEYPLHIGITEAGGLVRGSVKSAVGLGILLWEGLGDTLRVSLTADPVQEVVAAYEILRSLGLRNHGPEIISCPTCGRTEIDLIPLAQEVEKRLATETIPLKVAVMGCAVNGPGEAREADIGLAGGRDKGIIFCKGEIIRSVHGQEALLAAFMEELDKLLTSKKEQVT